MPRKKAGIIAFLLTIAVCLSLFTIVALADDVGVTIVSPKDAAANLTIYFYNSSWANIFESYDEKIAAETFILSISVNSYDTEHFFFRGWKIQNTLYTVDTVIPSTAVTEYANFANVGGGGGGVAKISNKSLYIEGNVLADFTVEAVFEHIGTSAINANAVSSDTQKGNVDTPLFFESNNTWFLEAVPRDNYMLDYWECTSGSGTCGDGTVFNSTTNKRIDVPDDRYTDALTVTLTSNSAFKAYFKPAKIILIDGLKIFTYNPAVPKDPLSIINGAVENNIIRAGNRAEIWFRFKTPSVINGNTQGVKANVTLYKDKSTTSFFSGTYSTTSLSTLQMYFCVRVPSLPAMDGFTASVSINGGEASTRYYSLEGWIDADEFPVERANAMLALGAVHANSQASAVYTSVKWQIENVYALAADKIRTAESAADIKAAANTAIGQITALISGTAHPGVITVAASVDKLTVNGQYIVEPILLRLPEGTTAAEAVLALLEAKYPDIAMENPEYPYPYRWRGDMTTGFYLEGVWDPDYITANPKFEGYISEFDEGGQSGWMFSVNNIFPGYSAGLHILRDGDVMRWQYSSSGIGADIGGGGGAGGDPGTVRANKDALTRKIAELNKSGQTSGDKYTAALAVLKKLAATQSEVDAALAAFYPIDTSQRFVAYGYGGTVALADENGHYVITASASGYVIKDVWIDGVAVPEASGKTTYTTKATPARSIFASFKYNAAT
jgi:hypothetical protein